MVFIEPTGGGFTGQKSASDKNQPVTGTVRCLTAEPIRLWSACVKQTIRILPSRAEQTWTEARPDSGV